MEIELTASVMAFGSAMVLTLVSVFRPFWGIYVICGMLMILLAVNDEHEIWLRMTAVLLTAVYAVMAVAAVTRKGRAL